MRFLVLILIVLIGCKTKIAKKNDDTFRISFDRELLTLNPYTQSGFMNLFLADKVFSYLLDHDLQTYESRPSLASRWEMDPQGRFIDFWIRPEARWQDGQPVTAEDVKFTFDSITDPRYKALLGVYWKRDIDRVEILKDGRVRFIATRPNVNLEDLVGHSLEIYPKHFYLDPLAAQKWVRESMGSGPYRISMFEPGKGLMLERKIDWWGKALPHNRAKFHFVNIQIID